MEINDCLPHLLYKFKSEQELFDAIAEISKKFTTNRESISDYLHDERLVSAYTLFYLLTNMPKFEGILKLLPPNFVETLKTSTFIDVGAGPGTYSFAFKEWVQSSNKVYQIEHSQKMKEQGRILWNAFYNAQDLVQVAPGKDVSNTVMFFGHSANEMGAKVALDYIKRINPSHIIFLEPGTKSFFQEMLTIRASLLREDWNQVYPCATAGQCPMEQSDNWCHQYLHHVHTPELERLSQKLGINRRYMAMTLQVFSRGSFTTNKAKIIQIKSETKFSFEWLICSADNTLLEVQVMKKGLSKEQAKKRGLALAGELIEYQVEKELEGNKKRIKLID